jgi:hypothetical protein
VCLAAGTGDPRACFDEALAGFARARMPIEEARCRLELAAVSAPRCPEVALAEARTALGTFHRLHATRDAAAASALLRSLGVRTVSTERGPEGLTRREAEVLDLLGHGFGWPIAEKDAYQVDVQANYLATLELAPEFADRVRGARREERFTGGGVPNFFRRPFGPGWALVGDAGYTKDPITAQGISDAFRDAELCAAAVHEAFTGRRPYDEVMAAYQRRRDAEVLPIYRFTTQMATLEAPLPQMQRVLGAVPGCAGAASGFAGVVAGTVSPAEFFHPDHVARILGAAA